MGALEGAGPHRACRMSARACACASASGARCYLGGSRRVGENLRLRAAGRVSLHCVLYA